MSKYNVNKKDKPNQKPVEGWDAAIADARLRIKEFQRAIPVYAGAKKAGEPWPVVQLDCQETEPATQC